MMVRLVRRSRSAAEVGWLIAACWMLSGARRVVPLSRLARLAWQAPRGGRRDPEAEARAMGLVLKAARWSGGLRRNCLARSLLLYRSLSRAGADPRLVVGVRRAHDRVRGHAWVVVDGRVAAEARDDLRLFTPVLAFGERGRLAPSDPFQS
jgi:hypothetical protein